MVSFFAHATEQGGFHASGDFYGTTYTIDGAWEQDSDGQISVRFTKWYAKDYSTEYYSGHVLPDGSIAGTHGLDENASGHEQLFVLRRASDEIMRHRPSPVEFQKNKPKALWTFAREAVLAQVRRSLWSWTHFAQRRDRRNAYVKTQLRMFHYGRPLSDNEKTDRCHLEQSFTARDISFVRSYFENLLRIIPDHK